MARVRIVEIKNFRGIKELRWLPAPGLNCLIGPGDSGKSTILDAIDLCIGARRYFTFTDADFHRLDVGTPIEISLTLGGLSDQLKNLDAYGIYLRGFDALSGKVEDEPEKGLETVLTVKLTVAADLEPVWTLVSDRATTEGQARNLSWADRTLLAPTRIGAVADHHLGWRRGSVLNQISEERADATAALAKAARDARAAFGNDAQAQLGGALEIVAKTAMELGIPVGDDVKAMLDAHSISLSGGTISLHDEHGVPLRGLGTGSTRLLIAGLQRKAASKSTIILIDELEHGLEPHRIIRLLGSLGAKEKPAPLQAFMTSHSPVALRELSGSQLFRVRDAGEKHEVLSLGNGDEVQSTVRLFPEAFLAESVFAGEGASEVGLLRGLDQFRAATGKESISACGVALIDCGGGEAERPFLRAGALLGLGYRAAVIRDDDLKPGEGVAEAFVSRGGKIFVWHDGRTLEDGLFLGLSESAVMKLLDRAVEIQGEEIVNQHIKSASSGAKDLDAVRGEALLDDLSVETRALLGRASRMKRAGWFKSVSWMESVARDIVGPDLATADAGLKALIDEIFAWAENGGG